MNCLICNASLAVPDPGNGWDARRGVCPTCFSNGLHGVSVMVDLWDHVDDGAYAAGPKLLSTGMWAWVTKMTFGKGRLVIGHPGSQTLEDGWCYESLVDAVKELLRWDGTGEPQGWMRHPATGRRRPTGDPLQEYVYL
jgi:hypothetical protein